MEHATPPTTAAFVIIDDSNWRSLPVNLSDLSRQRDVTPHIVVLDQTDSGVGRVEGATVVRLGPGVSSGESLHAGLDATAARLVALCVPGVRSLPARFGRQHAELTLNPHIDAVTSNLVLVDEQGCLVAEANPYKAAEAPTPFWQAGTMFRRSALATAGRSPDFPEDLRLYLQLRARGRTRHLDQVLSVASKVNFDEAIEGSLRDALAVRKISPPIQPPSHRRPAARPHRTAGLVQERSASDALDRMIREGAFDR